MLLDIDPCFKTKYRNFRLLSKLLVQLNLLVQLAFLPTHLLLHCLHRLFHLFDLPYIPLPFLLKPLLDPIQLINTPIIFLSASILKLPVEAYLGVYLSNKQFDLLVELKLEGVQLLFVAGLDTLELALAAFEVRFEAFYAFDYCFHVD